MIELQPMVKEKARQLGDRGKEWMTGLPALITALEREWSITVGEPLSGGSAAYVARARTADGRHAVLKLAIPDPEFASQVWTIAAARGRGYARLIEHDLERHAMLLEALGSSMDRLQLPPERMIELLSRTLEQAWRVPRWPGLTVTQAQEKAGQLSVFVSRLWEQLDRPCPERVVTQALDFAHQRAAAFDLDGCVVVHGDPHPANALQVTSPREGAESGFVFVDPDGFLADPAYDLGVVLRGWCSQLLAGDPLTLARRYCRQLANCTGVDETAIWQWGFLERVATGLFIMRLGAEELARPFLVTAEHLV